MWSLVWRLWNTEWQNFRDHFEIGIDPMSRQTNYQLFSVRKRAPSSSSNAVSASVVSQSDDWEPSILKGMIWMVLHIPSHYTPIAAVFSVYSQQGIVPHNCLPYLAAFRTEVERSQAYGDLQTITHIWWYNHRPTNWIFERQLCSTNCTVVAANQWSKDLRILPHVDTYEHFALSLSIFVAWAQTSDHVGSYSVSLTFVEPLGSILCACVFVDTTDSCEMVVDVFAVVVGIEFDSVAHWPSLRSRLSLRGIAHRQLCEGVLRFPTTVRKD